MKVQSHPHGVTNWSLVATIPTWIHWIIAMAVVAKVSLVRPERLTSLHPTQKYDKNGDILQKADDSRLFNSIVMKPSRMMIH